MREALRLAREAGERGEIPVGCVVVKDGAIIGRGRNCREELHRASAHAEVAAIDEACRVSGDWRLDNCELYVTLEPCAMCAGAIMNARIGRVVYGARDRERGALGGVLDLYWENFGFHPLVEGGVLADECSKILRDFFENLRSSSV